MRERQTGMLRETTGKLHRLDSDQSCFVGLRMFEADNFQSQRLLHFGHVRLPGCLQQWVTFELI